MKNDGVDVPLYPDERIDDLGRRGYRVIQNRKKFCFGVDAALLAWFAEVRPGERVMDLGTGTGIIPLLMDARYGCGSYVGLEIQPDMAEMAARSVKLNAVEEHMEIVTGDLCTAVETFGKGSFQVVTCNPPYMPAGSGLTNPDNAKAAARHEIFCTLEDVVREAAGLLAPGGRFYMVHRPARLPGILERMRNYGIAPSRLTFVHAKAEGEATMVLAAGIRGGRNILKVEAPVILYESEKASQTAAGPDGSGQGHTGPKYTKQVERIYNE